VQSFHWYGEDNKEAVMKIVVSVVLMFSLYSAQLVSVAAASESDDSGIGALLVQSVNSFKNGGAVADDLVIILATKLQEDSFGQFSMRGPIWEILSTKLTNVQNGHVVFGDNRKLPAAIVMIEIKTVNRSAGRYGTICIKHAAIRDYEFRVLRRTRYELCAENKEIFSSWIKSVGFQPE